MKNWRFQTVVLEKILESPLDSKEIKPVNAKGNQSCIFIGKADAEAEASILWPTDGTSWLIGKDLDAGKEWKQEEKGMTEDEMFGWHHWLNGHEFEQTLRDSGGQGSLACCSPWGSQRVRYNSVTEQPCQVSTIISHFTGVGGMLCSGHRPGACLDAGNNTEANFFFSFKNVSIWLCWVSVAAHEILIFVSAHRIFSCSMWDLVPWPGIEPGISALGVPCLNHWTTRKLPQISL